MSVIISFISLVDSIVTLFFNASASATTGWGRPRGAAAEGKQSPGTRRIHPVPVVRPLLILSIRAISC